MRTRLDAGPGALADYEIIELLLSYALPRRDTKPLAKDLLNRFGSVRQVLFADPDELAQVKGFGPATGTFWSLLTEIWGRMGDECMARSEVLLSPRAIAGSPRARIGHIRHEEIWAAFLDVKGCLIDWRRMGRGTVGRVQVYIREVLTLALRLKAAGIVLVHNHPGGDPTPSSKDVDMTRMMAAAAGNMELEVLDHVVVTADGYYSLKEQGVF